jgi:hypothetical protein
LVTITYLHFNGDGMTLPKMMSKFTQDFA